MSDLLIYGDVVVHFSGQLYIFLFHILCKTEKNPDTELVIQKAALDISAFRNGSTRVETDHITRHNSECKCIFVCFHFLVEDNFHRIIGAGCLVELSVYMNRGITQLECAGVNVSFTRVNPAVFSFGVVCIHSADR